MSFRVNHITQQIADLHHEHARSGTSATPTVAARTTWSARPRPSGTRSGSIPTSARFLSPGPTPNRNRMHGRRRPAKPGKDVCVPRVPREFTVVFLLCQCVITHPAVRTTKSVTVLLFLIDGDGTVVVVDVCR